MFRLQASSQAKHLDLNILVPDISQQALVLTWAKKKKALGKTLHFCPKQLREKTGMEKGSLSFVVTKAFYLKTFKCKNRVPANPLYLCPHSTTQKTTRQ